MYCKKCGSELSGETNFCRSCGNELTSEPKETISSINAPIYCKKCGSELLGDSHFCRSCGNELSSEPEETTPSSTEQKWYKTRFGIAALAIAGFIILVSMSIIMAGLDGSEKQTTVKTTGVDVADKNEKKYSGIVSEEQAKILDAFGQPRYFSLYYLPKEDDQLIRTEVWYYPEHENSITFMGGAIFKVTEIDVEDLNYDYPEINPNDFDYGMNYDDVVDMLEAKVVEPVEFSNDLFEDDEILTYVADKVMFSIEKGKLVYMQTMGTSQ